MSPLRRWGRILSVAAAPLALILATSGQCPAAMLPVPEDHQVVGEIVIEATELHPDTLWTEPNRQVRFVNRSGHPIHLDLLTRDPERHHVFHVPETIWAIFHRPGRHPFEVHFLDGAFPTLRGAVEVRHDPFGRPDPLTCGGITVMGGCIER